MNGIHLIDATPQSPDLPIYSWRCIALDIDEALAEYESRHGKEFKTGNVFLIKEVRKSRTNNIFWMELSEKEFNHLRSSRP